MIAEPLPVAAVQTSPVFGDSASNLARSAELMGEAVAAGARLIVLPEASVAGYVFADRAEALRHAEPVPGGAACRAWARFCAEHRVWVAAGLTELAGDRVYNGAVLIGPGGLAGVYRKVHLWNDEKRIYSPGDLGFPVFDTPIGRIGLVICYDLWFPESLRACALAGADLVCAPSNWVPVPGQPAGLPPMAHLMCVTGAHSNQVAVAAASRTGVERGRPFIGGSVIVDHTGWPAAEPAAADPAGAAPEQIVHARLDPIGSRAVRAGNPFNQPLRDRRPEVYR
ncbi:nitrilase family protein [Actinomadura vinacea]|uniref:Nitrilase family protein n=1 Tax=Actinomadura vinacea TaxID=115336 RepID=A0ABN3JTW4_9ACTN